MQAEKTLKKDKEVANAADDEYRKTVIALAKHQDKYYTEDMPALLKVSLIVNESILK